MQQQKTTKKAAQPPIKVMTGSDVKAKIKADARNYPLLGFCVYWSMSNFRISHSKLKENLATLGIDEKYGKETTPKVIIGQIVNEYTDKHRAKHKVKDEDDAMIYMIHHKDVDENKENVNYRRETKITFLKDEKLAMKDRLVVEGFHKEEIEKKFAEYLGTYTTEQFRNMMLSYFQKECQAVTVRDRGGVYFIPEKHEEQMNKAAELFALLPGCDVERLPIVDTVQAKKSMWKALVSDIKADIELLDKELTEMKKPSDKVFANRVERYKELKAKASMYGELLSSTATDINSSIDSLSKRLKAKMDEVE